MTVEERVQGALRAAQPGNALRALVTDLAREGCAKAEIIESLENFLVRHRTGANYREKDEEALLDVLDALHGWCHPASELLPEPPGR